MNNIPLTNPDTHKWFNFEDRFSKEEIAKLEKKAELLNQLGRGDTASFYLYKK